MEMFGLTKYSYKVQKMGVSCSATPAIAAELSHRRLQIPLRSTTAPIPATISDSYSTVNGSNPEEKASALSNNVKEVQSMLHFRVLEKSPFHDPLRIRIKGVAAMCGVTDFNEDRNDPGSRWCWRVI
ncbi:hypothetical protein Droror1_Dr00022310 [Drosera rotundifolia]